MNNILTLFLLILLNIIVIITSILIISNNSNPLKILNVVLYREKKKSTYTNMMNLITYVIHYTPLKERKQFLLNELNKNSLIYHFIEDYDRENLSDEDLKIFDTNKVKLSMCSNISKHIDTYRNIMNNEYKYSLILEDDVILDDKFGDKLNKGLEQLPDDYDMLFIGNGCNLHIPLIKRRPDKFIYKKCREPTNWGGNGGTRCTDSYLVSKKGAKN